MLTLTRIVAAVLIPSIILDPSLAACFVEKGNTAGQPIPIRSSSGLPFFTTQTLSAEAGFAGSNELLPDSQPMVRARQFLIPTASGPEALVTLKDLRSESFLERVRADARVVYFHMPPTDEWYQVAKRLQTALNQSFSEDHSYKLVITARDARDLWREGDRMIFVGHGNWIDTLPKEIQIDLYLMGGQSGAIPKVVLLWSKDHPDDRFTPEWVLDWIKTLQARMTRDALEMAIIVAKYATHRWPEWKVQWLRVLVQIYHFLKRDSDTVKIGLRLLQHIPGDVEIFEALAFAYFSQDDFERAAEFTERWLTVNQENPQALKLQGRLAVIRDRVSSPATAPGVFAELLFLMKRRQFPKVISAAAAFLKENGDDLNIMRVLVQALRSVNNIKGALTVSRRMVSAFSEKADGYMELALNFEALGDYPNALQEISEAVRRDPSPKSVWVIAERLAKLGGDHTLKNVAATRLKQLRQNS